MYKFMDNHQPDGKVYEFIRIIINLRVLDGFNSWLDNMILADEYRTTKRSMIGNWFFYQVLYPFVDIVNWISSGYYQ